MPSAPPQGPTGGVGYDLAELESLAQQHHPALVQAQARIAAAQGRYVQAGLYPNPRLQYAGDEMGNEHSSGFQGGAITQEIVTGGKRRLDQCVACGDVRTAEQQLAVVAQRVLTDVRTEYYNVLAAQRAKEIAAELLKVGEEGVKAADQLYKAKQVSLVDVLQAQVERDSAAVAADSAGYRLDSAWRRLSAVTGIADLAPAPLRGELFEGLHEIAWGDALGRILSQSPELAAASASADRAQCALARAQRQAIPNFELEVGRSHDNLSGFDVTNVRVGFPLPVFDRNQGAICAAQADLQHAQAEIQRLELSLQARLATVYQRYASALNQADKYRKTILPRARSSLDLVTKGYQQGEFGYLQLLTAQRTYIQTNLDYVTALRELRESASAIDGMLLGDALAAGGGG